MQYITNVERAAKPTNKDDAPRIHVEDTDLWLPSMIPSNVRNQICIRLEEARQDLPDLELKLREAQCHSALDQMRRALRLKSHMVDWRNSNARGQREGLRSRVQIDRIERDCMSATAKYRAARNALVLLSSEESICDDFPTLHDADVRSYADPDLEANRKKKRTVIAETEEEQENIDDLQEDTRRPAGESRRIISWIWRHKGLSSLSGNTDQEERTDDSKFLFL